MRVLFGRNPFDPSERIPTFEKSFPNCTFSYVPDPADLPAAIADADIYMGWLDHDIYLAAKQLKWIQSPSSGVNYFTAIEELVEGDVLLTSASGTHGVCVAESTMAMILAHTRGITESVPYQQSREWAAKTIRPRLVVLQGSTLGIIGLGSIGRALAQRARGFEMKIVAVDVSPDHAETVDQLWGLDRLDDLLKKSDYVAVTVPYTPETVGMIGAREISLIKQGAMVVVMSRGGIVDETPLTKALREGKLTAVAMDVFDPEPPPPESELWGTKNLIMTPHIAGGTQLEADTLVEIFTENLTRLLRGETPLRNQVDKKRGY